MCYNTLRIVRLSKSILFNNLFYGYKHHIPNWIDIFVGQIEDFSKLTSHSSFISYGYDSMSAFV